MPGMNGIELLAQIGNSNPEIKRIIISEYVNYEIIRISMKTYNFDGCMSKPWNSDKLKTMVEAK